VYVPLPMGRAAAAAVMAGLLCAAGAHAAPIEVRVAEGYSHGFVEFFAGRKTIAHGELVQFPRDEQVENRLTVSFDDGSLYDETVIFTQARFFRLRKYHVVMKGPSFPEATEVTFDDGGSYRASIRRAGGKDDVAEGHVEVPDDVYNGLTSTMLKNLAPGETGAVHQLAFTPKPHLIDATLLPEAEEPFYVGTLARTATRYRVVLKVAGIAGIAATLIGKDPPDVTFWIARGQAPTFVRFEGPLFADGPVWRAERGVPRWER
jgi:hypothetical protein